MENKNKYFLSLYYNMPSQIFKKNVPNDILFDFLKSVCILEDDRFCMDNACFKRAVITEKLPIFLDKIIEYYHRSKQTYVTKKQTYTTLITIIRQICKVNAIPYTTQLVYDKSKYEIKYIIRYPDNST